MARQKEWLFWIKFNIDKPTKEIISDKIKFKELPQDVTIKQEAKAPKIPINTKKCVNDINYKFIYPSGSAPAKIYGFPKIHKLINSDSFPYKLQPIISFLGTYNIYVTFLQLIYLNNTAQRTTSHL